jgi:hypothetical protein
MGLLDDCARDLALAWTLTWLQAVSDAAEAQQGERRSAGRCTAAADSAENACLISAVVMQEVMVMRMWYLPAGWNLP